MRGATRRKVPYRENHSVPPKPKPTEEKKRPREKEEDDAPTYLEIAKRMGDFQVDFFGVYCKNAALNNAGNLKTLQEIAKDYHDSVLLPSEAAEYKLTDLVKQELVQRVAKLHEKLIESNK